MLCNIEDAPGYLSLGSDTYEDMQVELGRNDVDTTERQLGV